MPYYIFRIKAFGLLEQLSVYESFPEASKQAKLLRKQLELPVSDKVKVIFAQDPAQAEDLLCEQRVASPVGDD